MKTDTETILDEWGETLTVGRAVNSWSVGMAEQSWDTNGTITGDWQPVDGETIRLEAAMKVKSKAKVITEVDVDVEEDDKITRSDGTFLYVNYIRKHEDHWTIYLKKNQ